MFIFKVPRLAVLSYQMFVTMHIVFGKDVVTFCICEVATESQSRLLLIILEKMNIGLCFHEINVATEELFKWRFEAWYNIT